MGILVPELGNSLVGLEVIGRSLFQTIEFESLLLSDLNYCRRFVVLIRSFIV